MSPKKQLLELMMNLGIDAYITPMEDVHLNEFIGSSDKRIEYLTGFTGTSGIAITTASESKLLSDSRYKLLAARQLTDYTFQENELSIWIEYLSKLNVKKVGIDPHFVSYQNYNTYSRKLKENNMELVDTDDLVGSIWKDKPKKKAGTVTDLESVVYGRLNNALIVWNRAEKKTEGRFRFEPFSIVKDMVGKNLGGISRKSKLAIARKLLKKNEYLLITELDTIAWILNLRGTDIPEAQLFYAYLVISPTDIIFFSDSKINIGDTTTRPYREFLEYIEEIRDSKIHISGECNAFIARRLRNKEFTEELKERQSEKNGVELFGTVIANILDAIVLVRLYEWIESSVKATEVEIAGKFEELSKATGAISSSFPPMVAIGENGASLHHQSSARPLEPGEMIVLDTGNQYRMGSTDITRTICINPTGEQIKNYTLTLKAVLAAKMLSGPDITGSLVDKTARDMLARTGLDYESATGHGVGAGLAIHEHPPIISESGGAIKANQVFTVEPGYYEKGAYGIRIEDTVVAVKGNQLTSSRQEGSIRFEDISYVPYHFKLINVEMLTAREKEYLNEYNKKILRLIRREIEDGPGKEYLLENTRELPL